MRNGLNLSQIAKKLNISKQCLNYHIKQLKASRHVSKIGYGTWIVNEKEVKKSSYNTSKAFINASIIRGHGFVFTLRLPMLRNWENRESFLVKEKIAFIHSGIAKGSGLRIVLGGWKVWLYNRCIVFYSPKGVSFFDGSAKASSLLALESCFGLISKLESLLDVSFRIKSNYVVKVVKNHFGDVKNALAKDYGDKRRKLYLHDVSGQWLVIDASEGFKELETVHSTTAIRDMDDVVKPFFNSLKENPFTADDIVRINSSLVAFGENFNKVINLVGDVTKNQSVFDANMMSHIVAVQDLGSGVRRFNDRLDVLFELLKKK